MNIAIFGTGYVGTATSVALAHYGHRVVGVDIDQKKINRLNHGQAPFFEPGLETRLKTLMKKRRLSFTTDPAKAMKDAELILIAVGTPSMKNGEVDLRFVRQVAKTIGRTLARLNQEDQPYRLIVNKSTVPIGTGDVVGRLIRQFYPGRFEVVSNPEFLAQGQAVKDALYPTRIVVGGGSTKARQLMRQLYQPFPAPLVFTDLKTAEFIKYASNTFLATSISFINSLADLAEAIGVNIQQVALGMRLDPRIGRKAYLNAGVGFGGSCLPKDTQGLVKTARRLGVNLPLIKASLLVNQNRIEKVMSKIKNLLGEIAGQKIAVWGLSFKPGTDDTRESPAIKIIHQLVKLGAEVTAYDPVVKSKACLPSPVKISPTALEAIDGADCLVVMTEWPEFKKLTPQKIKAVMRQAAILDGRNFFSDQKPTFNRLGITYHNFGA